jgi:cytochrome c oxidase subunit 3
MSTTVSKDIKVKPKPGLGGGGSGKGGGPFGPGPGDPGGPGDWPPGLTRDDVIEPVKYRIGIWVALAGIMMLFAALTSALIIRQNRGLTGGLGDWVPIAVPPVMWASTVLLLISSGTLEVARRALTANKYGRFRLWLTSTTVLGIAFLFGQVEAWRGFAAQGVYINSHPHSSFFYLLTSVHAIHLLGGLIALGIVTVAALRMRISAKKRLAVGVTSIYWHFMDGLWVYLFVLLFFWK